MADAIREITIEQGIDPRELKLLAFGGAGPLMSNLIARELDIKEIIIPPFSGNFSGSFHTCTQKEYGGSQACWKLTPLPVE